MSFLVILEIFYSKSTFRFSKDFLNEIALESENDEYSGEAVSDEYSCCKRIRI